MEFTGIELFIPAVVSAIIVAARQITASLDGPAAYWWSIALNIAAQVTAALVTGDAGVVEALGLGAATGAVVSPGLAASAKRLGARRAVMGPDRIYATRRAA